MKTSIVIAAMLASSAAQATTPAELNAQTGTFCTQFAYHAQDIAIQRDAGVALSTAITTNKGKIDISYIQAIYAVDDVTPEQMKLYSKGFCIGKLSTNEPSL